MGKGIIGIPVFPAFVFVVQFDKFLVDTACLYKPFLKFSGLNKCKGFIVVNNYLLGFIVRVWFYTRISDEGQCFASVILLKIFDV